MRADAISLWPKLWAGTDRPGTVYTRIGCNATPRFHIDLEAHTGTANTASVHAFALLSNVFAHRAACISTADAELQSSTLKVTAQLSSDCTP